MNRLFQQLCDINTLYNAWKTVKAKNAAGGIDGYSVTMFDSDLKENLNKLQDALQNGSWNPEPYLRIEIKKNETEMRKLGLLSINDKIVQQAIKTLIEPSFERTFLSNSYGYRSGKGHYKAVKCTINKMQTHKKGWVAKLDIDNYFDTIDHAILFSRLQYKIYDKELLRLIELSVKTGIVNQQMKWNSMTEGLPQGAILSPLLANFYLHPFDQFVTSQTQSYIRYADDFIILADSEEDAKKIVQRATDFLNKRLHLKLNEPSIGEVKNGVEFLGVIIKPNNTSISPAKEKKLQNSIQIIELAHRQLTPKSIESLNGIKLYYGRLLPQKLLKSFDDILSLKVASLIEQHIHAIPNKKTLNAIVATIPFFSTEAELNRKKQLKIWGALYSEIKIRTTLTNPTDKTKNKKLIQQKKREYQKREGESSELIISSYGSFIGKNNRGITIKLKGKNTFEKPTLALEHITVTTPGVSISSAAIYYCMEHNIPVDFFDHSGKLYASILSPIGINQSIWHQQALLPLERKAQLASSIILGKLKNQQNLIKYFHKYHNKEGDELSERYTEAIEQLKKNEEKAKKLDLNNPTYAEVLRGYESAGAIAYWAYIRQLLLDDKIHFDVRIRQGATDLVNSLLNYGYAILYTRIWQAVLAAKLNPSISVLHVYQAGKPAFIYDLIEIFRSQAVDRMVIRLIQKRESLAMDNNLLDEKTKNRLIQTILERMNRYEKFRNQEMRFSQIIKLQAKEIASYILDQQATFKPYVAKW